MKTRFRQAARLADSLSEWLVLVVLLAASVPPILLRHRSLTAVPELNLLDGSWLLDLSYKASGGIWLGRDVAFTYGPLFQWLSSAPARRIGVSFSTIFATWYTLPLLAIVIATFLTSRLLLPKAAGWQRALLLLLAVVFWSPPDLRISICLLAFAIFLRMTDAGASGQAIFWRAATAAAICIAAFWISFDTGLYCTAALLFCVAATSAIKCRVAPMTIFLLVSAGCSAILVLLTNLALLSLFDFRFWRSGFAIVQGYRWFEPFSISSADERLVLETLGVGSAVFTAAWRGRKHDGDWTRKPPFLLSGFCLALLFLQSALVRSDHTHVLMGIYPMIFLCGAIALSRFGTTLVSASAAVVVVGATAVLASPYPRFTPQYALSNVQRIIHPVLSCSKETIEFEGNCFPPSTTEFLRQVSDYVNSEIHSGEQIAIFPYETAFGLASRHQVAGGVLQSYLVGGDHLTDLELTELRRSNPRLALYLPDGQISVPIDHVPNFTRSPELWFYLLRHYRVNGSPFPGVVGIIRDENRAARLELTKTRISEPLGVAVTRQHRASIPIAIRNWPVTGADFLKLRLKVSYPFWWRFGKPSGLSIELAFADGSNRTIALLAQPNYLSDVWIYPWQPETMAGYFSDDSEQWRPGSRPALVSLNLVVQPYDWASAAPYSISLEDIEAVELELK